MTRAGQLQLLLKKNFDKTLSVANFFFFHKCSYYVMFFILGQYMLLRGPTRDTVT